LNQSLKGFVENLVLRVTEVDTLCNRKCLTWNLNDKQCESVTEGLKDQKDNVKLLIAPSGAGKTRSAFELLAEVGGIYFTLSQRSIGSRDLVNTLQKCMKEPNFASEHLKHMLSCA
jgi:hypothetical protein